MTLRVAQVGLGRWAHAHAAAAHRSERVEVVSCFTRDGARRAAFASQWSVPTAAESYESILADESVDAVVLSTPNDVHVDMALAALAAHKAVLIDKPVAVSVAEGLALLRATGGPPVGVAHHPRRLAGHRAIHRWHRSGAAGDVRTVHATFSNNRGAAMKPDAWHRTVRGSEAGVLIQVGIHQIDNVLALLGPAVAVNARFEYGVLGDAMPVTAMVMMTHANGALASVSSSWTTPSHYRFDVEATGGNMEFRLDHRHWTSADIDDHAELISYPTDGDRTPYPTAKGDPLRDQLDDLADAVEHGSPYEPGVVAGLRALAVVEASVLSAAHNASSISIPDLFINAGATPSEIATLT